MKKTSAYDGRYSAEKYYWGKKPSAICDRIIEMIHPSTGFKPRLIDLGCGEGRNAIYFAKHGFDVVALDISEIGLEKTRKYAEEEQVLVKTVEADIVNYRMAETYDVVFSTGTLHFLPTRVRKKCFENYKTHTSPEGVNAVSVFVKKPFIAKAPDADKDVYAYKSGELMGYYWDWEILYTAEEIFDCMSSGIPHKHAVNRVIARRPRL